MICKHSLALFKSRAPFESEGKLMDSFVSLGVELTQSSLRSKDDLITV
jgi:hypothetical protein